MTYAQLFPGKVRATLLDGAPDPVAWTTGHAVDHRQPFSVRVDSQHAAERRARVLPRLVPGRRARALRIRLGRHPCQVRRADGPAPRRTDHRRPPAGHRRPGGPDPVTYAFVVDGLRGGLQFPPIWADLAGLLEADVRGSRTPTPPRLRHRRHRRTRPRPSRHPPMATGEATTDGVRQQPRSVARRGLLGDPQPERSASRWAREAAAADRDAPYFGADFTWLSLPCATWPATTTIRSTARFDAATANPLLFVNARFDAASPLAGAERVAARMPGAGLLTVEGAGHPASFMPNECVADAVSSYLIDQVLPAAGAVCQAEFVPFS